MTDKKKIQDKSIWNRLGFELTVLWDLLVKMRVDSDYQGILPQNMFVPLEQAIDKIGALRSKSEDRMWNMTPFHDLHIFYPVPPETFKAVKMANEFRQKVKEAADERNLPKMNKTIEIPADVMEATVAEVRHLERFSGLSDAEIVETILTAGVNKTQAQQ